MASGLEMFQALRARTKDLSTGSTFLVNIFDKLDLCKLTPEDLRSVGFSQSVAEQVSANLMNQSLDALGNALGLKLVVDKNALNLIPAEGMKRAAETLRDDPQSLEEMLQEVGRMRHPERYPR